MVRPLEGDNRIAELAEMLGGGTEPNLESARQLVIAAEQTKDARAEPDS